MSEGKELSQLVNEFVRRYRKEFDFYEQASRMAAQMLDAGLRSAGVRAIVTSRAKNPSRLEEKIRQRSKKSNYKDLASISDDIADLAGVRVALYFPAESQETGKIIRTMFTLIEDAKTFPDSGKPTSSDQKNTEEKNYIKRFSGYSATHYRVQIPDNALNESQKRYAEAKIEIQVASVLMHAWSEVEHDLVYKPLLGNLSLEEYAILDELNGLVISGEIALERLQRAGEIRASTNGRPYGNHFELAASILDFARSKLSAHDIKESEVGRVDELFELLKSIGIITPERLAPYLAILHTDFDQRPLSDQIIDQLLSEDPRRYFSYRNIHRPELNSEGALAKIVDDDQKKALDQFIEKWSDFEKSLRTFAAAEGRSANTMSVPSLIKALRLPQNMKLQIDALWSFRVGLIHGTETPPADVIKAANNELTRLQRKWYLLIAHRTNRGSN